MPLRNDHPEQGEGFERDEVLGPSFDFLRILSVLHARWLRVALVVAVAAVLTVLYAFMATPVYRSSSSVLLVPSSRQPFDQPNASSGIGDQDLAIDSQVAVIGSNSVLRRVVITQDLLNDPEFGGASGQGMLRSLIRMLRGSPPVEALSEESRIEETVQTLAEKLTIRRSGQTYVIDISAESINAGKAARLAQAVANSYLTDLRQNREENAQRISSQIKDRLVQVRERLRQTEEAVQKFRAENRLQNAIGGESLIDQELGGLNGQLVTARAALAAARARSQQLGQYLQRGVDPQALGDVASSQTIARLREQYANASRDEANLSAEMLPSHPALIRARSQVERLRGLIEAEIRRISDAARIEATVASQRVANLEAQMELSRGDANLGEAARIRLRELETEARATRTVYESILSRAKEIEQFEGVYAPEARIITPAIVPDAPVWPKKKILLVLGAMVGGVIGVVWAVGGEIIRQAKAQLVGRRRASETAAATMAQDDLQLRKTAASETGEDVGETQVLTILSRIPPLTPPRRKRLAPPTLRQTLIAARDELSGVSKVGGEEALTAFQIAVGKLLAQILRAGDPGVRQIALMTSLKPGQGQTVTAASLAFEAARAGLSVLLIDADTQNPALSEFFEASAQRTGRLRDRLIEDDVTGVGFMSLAAELALDAGTGEAAEDRFWAELADVAESFDLSIIDGAPLDFYGKSAPLANLADLLLTFVPGVSKSSADLPEILCQKLLTLAAGRPCAAVLTGAPETDPRAELREKISFPLEDGAVQEKEAKAPEQTLERPKRRRFRLSRRF